jgi:hypothetical protein
MKNIFILFAGFCCFQVSSASGAATSFDHQATNEELRTSLEKNSAYHKIQTHQHSPSTPALTPFRPAEDTANFAYVLMSAVEPNQEVTNLRKTIAQNLPAGVQLVILADTTDIDTVKAEYAPWIEPERLLVVTDSFTDFGLWARDAFPVPVYDNAQKKLSLVSAKYYREFNSGDAIAKGVQASHLEKKDFTFVGGNLIADEDGNCFSVDSSRLFGTTPTDLIGAYGCKTHHLMPHAAGIGDVDEVLKPLSKHRILTNVVAYRSLLESWGYQVILLPALPGFRTYANSLIVKNVVFMPSYGIPQDSEAQGIYEKLGYKVFPVPSQELSDTLHGSIHCQTMAYPAMDPTQDPATDAKEFLNALHFQN